VFGIITEAAIGRRLSWLKTISQICNNFDDNTNYICDAFADEIRSGGKVAIVDHLRRCGDIPESYAHDSSEEKLYSNIQKY
jgi:type II restriction enzyme